MNCGIFLRVPNYLHGLAKHISAQGSFLMWKAVVQRYQKLAVGRCVSCPGLAILRSWQMMASIWVSHAYWEMCYEDVKNEITCFSEIWGQFYHCYSSVWEDLEPHLFRAIIVSDWQTHQVARTQEFLPCYQCHCLQQGQLRNREVNWLMFPCGVWKQGVMMWCVLKWSWNWSKVQKVILRNAHAI